MVRSWTYVEPGDDGVSPVYKTLTEAQILEEYFPWWKAELVRLGREHLISEQACIEDWVTVHWAWTDGGVPERRDVADS